MNAADTVRVRRHLDDVFGPDGNSTTRLGVVLRLLREEDGPVFWAVFNAAWPGGDATWARRHELVALIRRKTPWRAFAEPGDAAFYDGLPAHLTIYRGCTRRRVAGVSWTTDRDVAADFARGHHGIPVSNPVIASVTIPKSMVLAAQTERQKAEVLISPRIWPRRFNVVPLAGAA